MSTTVIKYHCQILIHRITSKINCWNTKHLPYASKTQLVNIMLKSMFVYRCCAFILPTTMIKEAKFLWIREHEIRREGSVAWEKVSKLKSKGSLGVKDLYTWNKTVVRKFI